MDLTFISFLTGSCSGRVTSNSCGTDTSGDNNNDFVCKATGRGTHIDFCLGKGSFGMVMDGVLGIAGSYLHVEDEITISSFDADRGACTGNTRDEGVV